MPYNKDTDQYYTTLSAEDRELYRETIKTADAAFKVINVYMHSYEATDCVSLDAAVTKCYQFPEVKQYKAAMASQDNSKIADYWIRGVIIGAIRSFVNSKECE